MRDNRFSWTLLAVPAIGAPFPFGSVDAPLIAIWCIVLGAGLACCSVKELKTVHVLLLAFAALLTAAFGFVVREQMAENAWYAEASPVWSEAARLLQSPLQPIASVVRNQPWNAIGNPLLGMLALMLGFVVGTDPANGRRLLRCFAWAGAAYAGFALVMFAVAPGKVLWRDKIAHADLLTGTFLNRNTAAAFFGTAALLWLAIIARRVGKILPRRMPSIRKAAQVVFSSSERGSIVLAATMYLLCLTALFLTISRAGILLTLAAMTAVFMAAYRRMTSARMGLLTVLLVSVVSGIVVFQTIGAGIGARIDQQGLSDINRMATYKATWDMIGYNAYFGTGLGTFEMVYPAYRSADITLWGIWNRAHNTWLELASDLGLPFMALFSAGWLAILIVLLKGFWNGRDPSFLASGTAIFVVASIHSMVDYPLQIPGYNVMFWAIVGTVLANAVVMWNRHNESRAAIPCHREIL